MTRCSGASVTVKARAISTIWRWPSVSVPTVSLGEIPWPGRISSSFSLMSLLARRFQPKPLSAGCMIRVFSATVRLGQSDNSWKTQRMPLRCAAVTE